MATATTPERVTVDAVPELTTDAVEYGLDIYLSPPAFEAIDADENPSFYAWDNVINEVRAEIAPEVARLYTEAVRRRLPWTWEPER